MGNCFEHNTVASKCRAANIAPADFADFTQAGPQRPRRMISIVVEPPSEQSIRRDSRAAEGATGQGGVEEVKRRSGERRRRPLRKNS